MRQTALLDRAAALLGIAVRNARPLSGGDLSQVWHLDLADGTTCVAKETNGTAREAAMLRAIAATGAPAPRLLASGGGLLLMEHLPCDGALADAWGDLAEVLSRLHGALGPGYGWHEDHAFGPVAIPNGRLGDWPAFWAERRLRCHLPHIPARLARRVEALASRIADHLPAAPPASLLHGDLWGGNVLCAGGRISGLIDPACYHGDREVDIAMLTLFDSPPSRFFDALGLEPGWRERQSVYRLWPLLVHLRLFGVSYESAVSYDLERLGC